ncbi:MAG TPA: hypothetical protein VE871_04800 [Longimicrobium sp.]|nr:hypothetical protein [Longimicrobium sp.]
MAVRTFESPDGATWSVWEVIPGRVSDFRSSVGSHLPRELAHGWLCFDCGTQKRRLAPLPANWHERTDEDFRFWLRAAVPVPVPARGVPAAGCDPAPAEESPASGPGAMAGAEDGMAVA